MFPRSALLALPLLLALAATAGAADRVAPKVLVMTMFGGEAKPWLDSEPSSQKIRRSRPLQRRFQRHLFRGRPLPLTTGHGLRERRELHLRDRLQWRVRSDQDLRSDSRNRGRRSRQGHARLGALGAPRDRRRIAERDRPARGAEGLALGLSRDRELRRPAKKPNRAMARRSIGSTKRCCNPPSPDERRRTRRRRPGQGLSRALSRASRLGAPRGGDLRHDLLGHLVARRGHRGGDGRARASGDRRRRRPLHHAAGGQCDA